MSKVSKKHFFLSIVFCLMTLAQAQIHDRMSAFSNSFVVQSQNRNTDDSLSYAHQFDWLFFLDRALAFNVTWNIGVDDEHRHSISLGLNKYFGQYTEISPFIQAHFSFLYSPSNEIGGYVGAGLEWNLNRFTDKNNLRINIATGYTQWFVKREKNISRLDLLKIGMGWHF